MREGRGASAPPEIVGPKTNGGTKKLTWVTDIPTPYRAHLLEALDRAAAERGIELTVLFMARTVAIRKWKIDPRKMTFRHRFARGVQLEIGPWLYHVNPGIPWEILKNPPDWLVVGGTWWLPTSLGAIAAARRAERCKIILHLEANRYAMTHRDGPVAAVRRKILAQADAYVVPGRIAIETLRDTVGVACTHFLPLPNVVDEARFGGAVSLLRPRRAELRRRHGIEASDRVMLWPARLAEHLKGILRFLGAVRDLVPPHLKILIAGEGEDKARIAAFVEQHLPRNVRLLGHRPEEDMLELLAAADALLLPSIVDPNPLSVVEALWAGLPVFISSRCGNSPEAVEGGGNGWVVDPYAPDTVRTAFTEFLARSPEELARMGERSRAIAEERFSTRECVRAFVDALCGV